MKIINPRSSHRQSVSFCARDVVMQVRRHRPERLVGLCVNVVDVARSSVIDDVKCLAAGGHGGAECIVVIASSSLSST